MSGITLEKAQQMLDAWLNAELAITTGQSYKMGSRELTRANLSHIRQQVSFWRKEVARLSGRRRKIMRVVPRDL